MIATPMLSITFRVRNASTIVSIGGTMLYHGAVCCDNDIDAITQMTAKTTAEATLLVKMFVFMSSIQPGVWVPTQLSTEFHFHFSYRQAQHLTLSWPLKSPQWPFFEPIFVYLICC
jgi:hypothetical protein